MREYKFNISITEECNLRCPHCYTKSKKGSLTQEQVDIIVGNLDYGLTRVKIEGGEVYMQRDLFYHTIRKFREKFLNAEIRVNTNGVEFYDNEDTIIAEAERLWNLGVKRIRVSLDEFHAEGGADLEKVASIRRVLTKIGHPLEVRYMSLTQALAMGNAEDLPDSQKERRGCMNDPDCLVNPYFFTDIRGDLYTCCWRLIPPLGNLLKSRLKDLVENMDTLQRKLLSGKIASLATTPDLQRVLKEWGECMLCKAVFGRDEKKRHNPSI